MVPQLTEGYVHYRLSEGNASLIKPMQLNEDVQAYMREHYQSPPRALSYISELRRQEQQRVCPMCGSMHRGTLDHLLPKEEFPEFAFFSLNLVPACKCNTDRGQTVTGELLGERVLHPYFDDCMSGRLIAACFEDPGYVPRVKLKLLIDADHPQHPAVAFHVRKVVERTAILQHILDNWINLCRKPRMVIRELARIPSSLGALHQTFVTELELVDEAFGGRNNWNSVFLAGLLEPNITQWLFDRLTAEGRSPDDPLTAP
ncbi:hypothetical protein WI91_27300 [Burkholderia vietnamiensis]|nr:hypothetical protein WI91_27300 [Burkholderia vietnamiensis]KVE54348.1 hypothetical protein WI94_15495 [Burkholderia vietnamiensis]KVE83100.1 hypothetical protein WJ00_24150 [Burkholderia vietnamiensis]